MTAKPFSPADAARFIADAHARRETYRNLPEAIAPRSIDDAYAAQEALRQLWEPIYGPVAGLKIAVTTKIMQELMGIDHPCGGMIYKKRVHTSPHMLRLADYMHVVAEFELAVRVGRTLAKKATPYTRDEVRATISGVLPAYELIEDRNAVYRESRATSLIADNAWNAGIVLGPEVKVAPGLDLNGITCRLAIDGKPAREGKTDDPMGALAWVVNLAADRGRPLEAGQVVITGSVIATLPIAAGEHFRFEIDGIGAVEMKAV